MQYKLMALFPYKLVALGCIKLLTQRSSVTRERSIWIGYVVVVVVVVYSGIMLFDCLFKEFINDYSHIFRRGRVSLSPIQPRHGAFRLINFLSIDRRCRGSGNEIFTSSVLD